VRGLIPLLEECSSQGGVHLIEIPIDYSEDERRVNEEIPTCLTGSDHMKSTYPMYVNNNRPVHPNAELKRSSI
jgi:hypothetical protein